MSDNFPFVIHRQVIFEFQHFKLKCLQQKLKLSNQLPKKAVIK